MVGTYKILVTERHFSFFALINPFKQPLSAPRISTDQTQTHLLPLHTKGKKKNSPPEAFRIMFHCHTSHQKPIKTDPPGRVFSRYRRWGESFLDFPDHLGREGKAKAHKGRVKFGAVDEAGRIAVEAIEDSVPVLFE